MIKMFFTENAKMKTQEKERILQITVWMKRFFSGQNKRKGNKQKVRLQ